MPEDWSVKDYWDWNPAFVAGLKEFQDRRALEQDRILKNRELDIREVEAIVRGDDREADRIIRRAREERLANQFTEIQDRLKANDLNKSIALIGEEEGFNDLPVQTDLADNPAYIGARAKGKQRRSIENQRLQDALKKQEQLDKLRSDFDALKRERENDFWSQVTKAEVIPGPDGKPSGFVKIGNRVFREDDPTLASVIAEMIRARQGGAAAPVLPTVPGVSTNAVPTVPVGPPTTNTVIRFDKNGNPIR